jgi:raffinose/stachyose/melibiose transport system permease protein
MKKNTFSKPMIHVLLIFYSIISIYPLFWLFLYSFKDNKEIFVTNPFGIPHVWRIRNYIDAISQFNVKVYFKNSLVVAALTIILVILLSLMFCYVAARLNNRATRFMRFLVTSGMFIPIQAVMIPLVIVVRSFGFTNSLWSVIIPYTALGIPFACMLLYGFYLGIPFELEESAYLDGASFGRTYFQIIFPQMKSAISVLVIYEFLSCWNEFNLALVLLTKDAMKTLPLGLVNFWTQYEAQWGVIGAAMIIASAPVLIVYIFFSNRIADAMSVTGMKN